MQHGKPALSARCLDSVVPDPQEAKDIGDEFLALEKFVNLNYLVRVLRLSTSIPSRLACCTCVSKAVACSTWLVHAVICRSSSPLHRERYAVHAQGFHKILKKHDKVLPHAPCQQFYLSHLHQQSWVQVTTEPGRHCPPHVEHSRMMTVDICAVIVECLMPALAPAQHFFCLLPCTTGTSEAYPLGFLFKVHMPDEHGKSLKDQHDPSV